MPFASPSLAVLQSLLCAYEMHFVLRSALEAGLDVL